MPLSLRSPTKYYEQYAALIKGYKLHPYFKDAKPNSWAILRAEMPKAKPSEDKCVLLLKKILARLDAMGDLSPELEKQLEINRLLVRKVDRLVPDRTRTKKE
jgi:hypothetical protein